MLLRTVTLGNMEVSEEGVCAMVLAEERRTQKEAHFLSLRKFWYSRAPVKTW